MGEGGWLCREKCASDKIMCLVLFAATVVSHYCIVWCDTHLIGMCKVIQKFFVTIPCAQECLVINFCVLNHNIIISTFSICCEFNGKLTAWPACNNAIYIFSLSNPNCNIERLLYKEIVL